jgi:PAS domain S-box-containing protein
MPAEAAASSPSVSDLQRRIEELSGELRARAAEHEEALQREAAMAEVLQVIKTSPGELEPVFHTILSNAIRLCSAEFGNLFLYKDDRFHVGVLHGAPPAYEEAWQREPAMSVRDHPHVPLARLAATRQVVHIHDVAVERTPLERDARYVSLLEAAGARTMLLVPMLRDEELIGSIVIYGREARPFTDKQIALLQNFAAQAIIAMENARLLTEQRDALEQQTATTAVLQVINSSPGNLGPVFDAIAESTARLCQVEFCHVFRFDGELIHFMASYGHTSEATEAIRRLYPTPPSRRSCAARAVLSGAVEQVADVGADPDYAHGNVADVMKISSIVAVPMLKEGRPVGAISLLRAAPGLFPQRQIALLQTFADQAVIAMENARLLTETREALEQQTATAEVLRVINSSPGDLSPVFDAILEKAMRLCDAAFGQLDTYDGKLFHTAAVLGVPSAFAEFRSRNPPDYAPGTGPARMLGGERVVRHLDLMDEDIYRNGEPNRRALVDLGGARSSLQVALVKDGSFLGFMTLFRQEVRPFSDKQIALLQNFAAQAVIAMENARLINETREALEQQTATSEVLQVINSSPGNLAPVFDAMLDKATRLSEAAFGILWTYDGERFQAVAFHDVPPAYVEFLQEPQLASPVAPLGRVARGEAFAHVADLAADEYQERAGFLVRQGLSLGGFRTVLAVPMRKDASLLGAITIYRREVQPFSDKQIALLQNFAAQAVIAMENARLINETRDALEQQTATAEVLQVINASPGDLTPVFETILEKAHALCEVAYGSLQLYEGEKFRAVAVHGLPQPVANQLSQGYTPGPNLPVRRLIEGEDFVHVPDLAEVDDPIARSIAERAGIRTVLFAALRKDGRLLGMIVAARKEVRSFVDKEIALLASFAAQAVIAMENARLLTELREALAQQTATAEVLRVINSSPGDLVPVFQTILDKAHALCGVAYGSLQLYDGERLHAVAVHGLTKALAIRLKEGYVPGADHPIRRLLKGEDFVHIDDIAEIDDPGMRAAVELGGIRTRLAVALRKDGVLLGQIVAGRQEVRPFTDKEIALMQSFSAQAVIAIENARLLTEQREALEQQTATAEVLQVINSSPGDLVPVFDSMLEKAMHLCGAAFGILWTYDGEWIRAAAVRGATAAYAQFLTSAPHRPGLENAHGRLLRGERFVHIADAGADAAYLSDDPLRRATVELGGARTILAVPLRQDDVFLGDIVIYRRDVQPFSEKQIALLENFAAQAVIAIENARLLTEQREALEQQTATAEVLEVINASPGNLAPVFDAMLERAVRLSQSAFGMMNLYEDSRFKGVALRGVPPGILSFEATPQPGPHNALTRLVNGEAVVHLEDLKAYRSYIEGDPRSRNLVDVCGARSLLAVALRKDDKLVGTLTAYRQEVRPFTDKQIALLESFAAQAVIAIDNARLLDELRQRQAELRVTFDNMGDGVAMFDADLRLAAWNRNFQEIIRLSDADLAARPTYAEYLRLLADRGEFGAENVEAALATRLQDTDKELRLERTRADGTVIEARRNAVPGGGFVLIYSDITERKRSEEQIKAARDMAETALNELKTAQSSLIHAEKMASLGQLTAGIAHEIKNPLNFVNNFAGLSVELLDELKEAMSPVRETLGDERRTEIDEALKLLNTNLDKIASHGRRADGIVRSMLLHSRGGSGDRQSVDINAVLEEALNLAYHGARAQDQSFNVSLERELQADMAPIEIVPQDVTRVFLNLIGNGFYAVSRRARHGDASFRPALRVRTRELGEAIEIAIRDNGIGIRPEHRERLFQPFFTTKPTGEGTGLGLSISYDIVTQQHSGTITVDSELGRFTEFTIRLPRVGPAAAGRRPA